MVLKMSYPTGPVVRTSQLGYESVVVSSPSIMPNCSFQGGSFARPNLIYKIAYAFVGVNNKVTQLSPELTLQLPNTPNSDINQFAPNISIKIDAPFNCNAVAFAAFYKYSTDTGVTFSQYIPFGISPMSTNVQIKYPWISFAEYIDFYADGIPLSATANLNMNYESLQQGALDEFNNPVMVPITLPKIKILQQILEPVLYAAYCYIDMNQNETQLSPITQVQGTFSPNWSKYIEIQKARFQNNSLLWQQIPIGACGIYVYLGRSPDNLHRQPCNGDYVFPIEHQRFIVHQFVESNIRPNSTKPASSRINPLQVAIKQKYRKIIVDSQNDLYCPIIEPVSNPEDATLGLNIVAETPITITHKHTLQIGGTGTPIQLNNFNMSLAVISRQFTSLNGLTFKSDTARVGLTASDPNGGCSFRNNFKKVNILLQNPNGLALSDNQALSVSTYCSTWDQNHTMSESRFEQCYFMGVTPINLEGSQTCNMRFSDTVVCRQSSGSYEVHSKFINSNTANFKTFRNGLYTAGVTARYLVADNSKGANGYTDIQDFFDDQGQFYVFVGRGANEFTQSAYVGLDLGKSNENIVSHRRLSEAINGRIRLDFKNYQVNDGLIYAVGISGSTMGVYSTENAQIDSIRLTSGQTLLNS